MVKHRLPVLLLACLCVTQGLNVGALVAQGSGPRPYRVDDRFDEEDIESIDVSPDGQVLSFVKLRAQNTVKGILRPTRGHRGDIWVQDGPGRPPVNVTNGLKDQSGWWNPMWSPNGDWLAFLSSRGGVVTLWGWDRRHGGLRQLSKRGIDYRSFYLSKPCRWVDGSRILCLSLQHGRALKPFQENMGEAVDLVTTGWAKAAMGEVTASVVDSRFFDYGAADLLLIDASSNTERVIGETVLGDHLRSGLLGPDPWWLSPTGEAVAYTRAEPIKNPADGIKVFSDTFDRWVVSIDVRRIDGTTPPFKRGLPRDVVSRTVQWSPNGQELVYWAYDGALDRLPHLFRIGMISGAVDEISFGDLESVQGGRTLSYPRLQFTPSGDMMVFTTRRSPAGKPAGRRDWWRIRRDGQVENLTASLKSEPDLQHLEGGPMVGGAFVIVADGDVWRFDPDAGLRNLTTDIREPIARTESIAAASGQARTHVTGFVAKPNANLRFAYALEPGIGQDRTGYYADVYLLDVRSGTARRLQRPMPAADPIYVSPATGETIYLTRLNGVTIWRAPAGAGSTAPVKTAELFRRAVARPEVIEVPYVTPDGVKRRGVLTLPKEYVQGRRYPVAITIRLGHPALSPETVRAGDGGADLLLAFAEVGYAAFYADDVGGSDYRDQDQKSLEQASAGVQAAADALIQMGVADPARLFLYGTSGNGCSVVKAITQTNRFKAVWAHVPGPAYGPDPSQVRLLDTYYRYRRNPHQYVRGSDRGGPDSPAAARFRDGGYVLAQIDRIATPILIVDGDLDGGLMPVNEALFYELVYRGKTAQFVRYWGMEHEVGGPSAANTRDLWQRVFAWFDDFGDVSRGSTGHLVFDGDRVRSRAGAPALPPSAFAKFGPASSPTGTNTEVESR